MAKEVLARDVMVERVVCVTPEMTLREASELLGQHQITGAPVVSEDEGLVGVISQTDIMREALGDEYGGWPTDTYYVGFSYVDEPGMQRVAERVDDTLVTDAMNTSVVSVLPSDPSSHVARVMRNDHIHRVLVAEDRHLQGIITSLDLLRLLEAQ